jgi:acetyl-CoA carboxylase carboxyltransferase component
MQTGVPRLSVVVRRCYGAAAFLMLQSRAQGGDLVLALEGARIAAMGFDAARHMVYPDREDATTEELRADYLTRYESAGAAFAQGLVDEVVAPANVRERLASHLRWLGRKRRTRRPATLLP